MNFDGVKSNEQTKNLLNNFFKNNKLPHAIIFEGAYSELRTYFAKMIIKYCACINKNKNGACNSCKECMKVDLNIHPDVSIITADEKLTSIHIDDIRKILEDVYIIPNEADYKVYLIEDADKMTIQASNALLKILEEPPSNVIFILTCQSSSTLITTVASRCQIFKLYSPHSNKRAECLDEKIVNISNQIIDKIFNNSQFDLIVLLSAITKNRKFFNDVLEYLRKSISDRCLSSYNNKNVANDALYKPMNKESSKMLVKLVDEILNFKFMLNKNVNLNLLGTCFYIKVKQILMAEC